MIASLIFPAVIAGVAVFFGSFLIWVVSKWHQEDFKPLPDEKGFLDAVNADIAAVLLYLSLCVDLYYWYRFGQ